MKKGKISNLLFQLGLIYLTERLRVEIWQLITTILKDKIDKDVAYIILSWNINGEHRAVEVKIAMNK